MTWYGFTHIPCVSLTLFGFYNMNPTLLPFPILTFLGLLYSFQFHQITKANSTRRSNKTVPKGKEDKDLEDLHQTHGRHRVSKTFFKSISQRNVHLRQGNSKIQPANVQRNRFKLKQRQFESTIKEILRVLDKFQKTEHVWHLVPFAITSSI